MNADTHRRDRSGFGLNAIGDVAGIFTATSRLRRGPRASLPPRHRRRGLRRPKPCRGRKVTPAKKAPRGAKTAETAGAREGSKTAKVLELLKRPGAATAKELMKATGLQPHSVRGFLSGTVGKKLGLVITSAKGEDGERSYSVKA